MRREPVRGPAEQQPLGIYRGGSGLSLPPCPEVPLYQRVGGRATRRPP